MLARQLNRRGAYATNYTEHDKHSMRSRHLVILVAALLGGCRPERQSEELTVGAAANLGEVFGQIGRAFREQGSGEVVFSYASTADLGRQITNGAPYDLFAAADTEHVDALIASGKLTRESRAVYALGQLAIWVPGGDRAGIKELKDLAGTHVRFVAVAQPELAPYGQATIDAIKAAGIWEAVQPKIVYANNITTAKQLAQSGNADAALTAYSLVLHEGGNILKVDPKLYHPIEQALAIVAASPRMEQANQFRAFILGNEGRSILSKNGYLLH